MAQTLKNALAERATKATDSSNQAVSFVESGDYLSLHFATGAYFAERIDDILTVYRSIDDGELVGCKIKGVSILARNVSSSLSIDDGDIQVDLLLVNAMGVTPPSSYYFDVCKRASTLKMTIPVQQLLHAA